MIRFKVSFAVASLVGALAFSPASASHIIGEKCVSVANAHGCLFAGNINENASPANVNGYVFAQNTYNTFNNANPSANPDITLTYLTDSTAADFSDFGSITGAGTSAGTWTLSGFVANFVAVKAADYFVLYQITPSSTGSWNTLDIPHVNGKGKEIPPHDLSHLVFFGGAIPEVGGVPEPSNWAMMIAGFGMVGGAMRARKKGVLARA